MEKTKLDEIKKGFYSLFDSYNNELCKLPKKGVDIKVGITKILANLTITKGDLLGKMNLEIGKLKFAPDTDSYYDKQYKHLLSWIPKRFSWDMIQHGEKYVKTDNGIEEQAVNKPTKEQAEEMREYNRYAEQYVEACIDEIKLNTLKNNLEDKKVYNLSVNQLTMLGF